MTTAVGWLESGLNGARIPAKQTSRRQSRRWLRHLLLIAMGVGTLAALVGVIGGSRSAVTGLTAADSDQIVLAAVLCALAFYAAAVAQQGAVSKPLPMGRLLAVQVACAFTNRILPGGLGTFATNGRFLRRSGLTSRQATAAVGLNGVAGVVVHVFALMVAVPWLLVHHRTLTGLHLTGLPTSWLAFVLLVTGCALGLGATILVRRRAAVVGFIRAAAIAGARTIREARALLGQRGKVGRLLGGSLGVTALHTLAFAVCVEAAGAHAGWIDLFAVYVLGSAFAAAVPTPGGLGALEASLFFGLSAIGLPAVPALAGVLWFRLISFWLPTLPGLVAFGVLLHRRQL